MTEVQPAVDQQEKPRGRRGLGRGLNSLLSDAPGREEGSSPLPQRTRSAGAEVNVDLIEANPFQPRRDFEPESLAELSASIRQHGVLQPLLVREQDGKFQLIAGERRWRAAIEAGLKRVPCRILKLEDKQVCEAAIEENLKRKDLNVLEKADAFRRYIDQFQSSIEELARTLSLNRSTVSNMLRLLELAEPVKQALQKELVTAGHARALLSLEPADQEMLCTRIQQEQLSVRQTEVAVRELTERQKTIPIDASRQKDSGSEKPAVQNNHLLSLQDQLREMLGARVEIKLTAKDKGRIIVEFQSNQDFERIVRQLRRAA